ncbi:MAG: hypothetical protein ACVCEJ_05715 [Candidatus Izemoplasmataceae bacterium]
MLESLGLEAIVDALEGLFDVNQYIDAGAAFLRNLGILEQIVVAILAVIITVLGTFELIKKLSKIVIVVAVLVGLYLLYDGEVFSSILG